MYENNQNRQPLNGMAIASFCCAALGLITCSLIFTAFCFGSLAILFAALSRGNQKKMDIRVRISQIVGICSIVIASFLVVYSALFIISRFGSVSKMQQRFKQYVQEYSQGDEFNRDEVYDDIYSDLYGDDSTDEGNTNSDEFSTEDSSDSGTAI